MNKREVFAVHNWETCDNKHHVSWTTNYNLNDNLEIFNTWEDALVFTFKKAKEIDAEYVMIDSPEHPHERIL